MSVVEFYTYVLPSLPMGYYIYVLDADGNEYSDSIPQMVHQLPHAVEVGYFNRLENDKIVLYSAV